MSETKRMADEADRMGQQAQEGFQTGLEAVSRSFSEANKGVQSITAELTDFSKDCGRMSFLLGCSSSAHDISETWSKSRHTMLKGRLTPTRPSGRSWVKCVLASCAMPQDLSKTLQES